MPRKAESWRPPWQPREGGRESSHRRGYGSANWKKTRMQVIARDGGICKACGEIVTEYHQIDHIVPKREGGTDELSNLQLLCRPCHSAKTRSGR